jgi:hypothetical protein
MTACIVYLSSYQTKRLIIVYIFIWLKNSQHYSQSGIEIWKWSLGTEEKRGTTFRSRKVKNQCIRQKTGAQNIVKEIKLYQKKLLQHVQRMDTNRLPKRALQYKPKGRRNIGRPRKRWRDNFVLRIKEQETRLTLQQHAHTASGIGLTNTWHCMCSFELVMMEGKPVWNMQSALQK